MVNPRYTPIFVSQGYSRLVGGTLTETTGGNITLDTFLIALNSSASTPPLASSSSWVAPTVSAQGPGLPLPNKFGVVIPPTAQRILLLLVDSGTQPGTYHVWAKVADNPELDAVWLAGPITVQ